jgi:hypothetical protein
MPGFRDNISTGLWWGIRYAAAYSLVGTLIAVARRGTLAEYGLTLPWLVGLYVVGGIGAGALAGLLLPLVRGELTAGLVGFVVAAPVMFMFAVALNPADLWSYDTVLAWLLSAALLGPVCGVGLWRISRRYSLERRSG